jgi:hypothetical protein
VWVARLIESADRWECVHFAARDELPVFEAFRDKGFHVATVSGAVLASELELFDALASAFAFPDYFGGNWDALVDCLGDLEWLDAAGYVLVVEDVGTGGLSEPLARLLQIWPSVAQEWSAEGKPFHLVGLLGRYGSA